MKRSYAVMASLLLGTVVLAGCFGGGDDAEQLDDVYQGEVVEYDLYLRNQQSELYPGTVVDSWIFAPDDLSDATLPGPTLRAREGDTLVVNFHVPSGAPFPHTIHWHGIHLPWDMDGVPYVSQLPIGDGAAIGAPTHPERMFRYEFTLNQSGTYFYHCHFDTAHHMDMGMYGALIVDPADPEQDPPYDREYTLQLDEWDQSHVHQGASTEGLSSSGDPETTADSAYSQLRDNVNNNPNLNTVKDETGVRQHSTSYPAQLPAYFADYDTFLINGKAYPLTEVLHITQGETIRIRFINTGFEVHAMHLHGHHMLVTHKDGYLLPNAYHADTILLGPGERYDVYVTGDNPGPWMLHDHIALNEANDHIHPGGMMTMLCYEDGWSPLPEVNANPCRGGSETGQTSGELLMEQANLLKFAQGIL